MRYLFHYTIQEDKKDTKNCNHFSYKLLQIATSETLCYRIYSKSIGQTTLYCSLQDNNTLYNNTTLFEEVKKGPLL